MRILTRPIWLLSLVSLFTDFASEMLYPIMPVYLREIGFSILLIGILEGIAEATAGLSKGYFGHLSDSRGMRVPFVRGGYALSALSKPMMAFFLLPWWVFLARTLDRLGKGLRTGARDALLSSLTTPAHKGRVFGFHRSMDTLGAVLGPLAALVLLHFFPGRYRLLFFLAFIPGVLAVAATFGLKETPQPATTAGRRPGLLSFLRYPLRAGPAYRRLLPGLIAFALINSSDLFLLLLLKESGLSDDQVLLAYILYNIVYAAAAYPFGILADRIGLKTTFLSGLLLFAAVYAGMAASGPAWLGFVLLAGYGLYAAATEGIAKAWISNLCPPAETATAIGAYEAMKSLAAIAASAGAGALWQFFGAPALFLATAGAAVGVALYIGFFTMEKGDG